MNATLWMKLLFTFYSFITYSYPLQSQISIDVSVSNCKESSDCSSPLDINPIIANACPSNDLWKYAYQIDIFNDGTIDVDMPVYSRQDSINNLPYSGKNKYAYKPSSVFTANGNYPIGTHRIIYSIIDDCLATAKIEKLFKAEDCTPPKPNTNDFSFTYFTRADGTIHIPMNDFKFYFDDNCSDTKIYPTFDPTNPVLVLQCSSLRKLSLCKTFSFDQRKYLTIVDDAGNKATDYYGIYIYDKSGVCGNINDDCKLLNFINPLGKPVHNINLRFSSSNTISSFDSLHCDNLIYPYYFKKVNSSSIIQLFPSKIPSHNTNDVDIFDAIMLYKAIIWQDTNLSNTYILAGDINRDNKLSAVDLAKIRRHIFKALTTNELKDFHWGFHCDNNLNVKLNSNREFEFKVGDLTDSTIFIAYKKGDLNSDALSQCNDTLPFQLPCLQLEYTLTKDDNSDSIYISIYTKDINSFDGLQACLFIDSSKAVFSDLFDFETENLEIYRKKNTTQQSILCYLNYKKDFKIISSKAEQNILQFPILLNPNISITDFRLRLDTFIRNVAYDNLGRPMGICLNYLPTSSQQYTSEDFKIYPNPGLDYLHILHPFSNNGLQCSIFNVHGNIVLSQHNLSQNINTKALAPGLYFIQFKHNNNIIGTRKWVKH